MESAAIPDIPPSAAIQTRASASHTAAATVVARAEDATTRAIPLVRSGVARQTYQADRQTKAYTSDRGSRSASDAVHVNPSRVKTADSRTPDSIHAAR